MTPLDAKPMMIAIPVMNVSELERDENAWISMSAMTNDLARILWHTVDSIQIVIITMEAIHAIVLQEQSWS